MIISDRNILTAKNELVSSPIEANEIIKLLDKELAYSSIMGRPGIGLAAPQIAINKQAAIVRIDNNGSYNLSINLINAKIAKMYDPFVFHNEGCLSFNDEQKDTVRYKEIYVINNMVEPYSFVSTGLMAVAIQHELDHLNGILFFDRQISKNISKIKTRPNDPCVCGKIDNGTGRAKKFKKCCGV